MLACVLKNLHVERWVLDKILWRGQSFVFWCWYHWLLNYSIELLFRVSVTPFKGTFALDNWFIRWLFQLRGYRIIIWGSYGCLLDVGNTFVSVYVRYGLLISHIFYLLLIIWIVFRFIGYFIYLFQLTFLLNRRFKSVASRLWNTALLLLSFQRRDKIGIWIFRVVCQIRCL